jgi:hypothetical protein
LLGAVVMASALTTTSVRADPCTKGPGSVPNCQARVQAGISYSGWDTKQWVYYCAGDHPYYWRPRYEWNSSCFSVAENPAPEDSDPSKFSATITNWCFKKETIVISLACSDKLQPRPCGFSLGCPSGPTTVLRSR